MKNLRQLFAVILLCAFAVLQGCTKPEVDADAQYDSLTKISFVEIDENFPNPERGYYSHKSFHSNDNPTSFKATVPTAERRLGRTLIFTIYYLEEFIDKPISEDFLAVIRGNMNALREGGSKCVLRFAYNDSHSELDHPWDADESVVLQHISQIKPILREYADVIFCVEAGFVGVYGEWYYTDGFDTQPDTFDGWQSRRRVVDALLEALPAERMVCIRTPEAKMGMYGKAVADSVTLATSHNGSSWSRLGAHNDCFVSSSNDVGTYNSQEERQFIYSESRYTIMGGETCALSKNCNCDVAVPLIEKHHLTYLNCNYLTSVLARWREQKCYDEITRRMGYRLVIDRAFVSSAPKTGESCRVVLKIRNVGYAAPMNPRDAELVLVSADGSYDRTYLLDADPRYWFEGGEYTIDRSLSLVDIPAGDYVLYLNLPDPKQTLRSNPMFSIRTANADTWDETKGYNKITTLKIN